MLSAEFMLETYPPETFFPADKPPSEAGPPEYSDVRPGDWTPINVGALQAEQVERAVTKAVDAVKTTVTQVTDFASKVGSWMQTIGGTAALIAVLGLGAWALSSVAAIRRRS